MLWARTKRIDLDVESTDSVTSSTDSYEVSTDSDDDSSDSDEDSSTLMVRWEHFLAEARNALPVKVLISKLDLLIREEILQYLSMLADPKTPVAAKEFSAVPTLLAAV